MHRGHVLGGHGSHGHGIWALRRRLQILHGDEHIVVYISSMLRLLFLQVPIRWFFDVVFFVDMIMSFFFENKYSTRNVLSHKEVQLAYLKKGFIVDLVTTFPLDYIPAFDILVMQLDRTSFVSFVTTCRLATSVISNIWCPCRQYFCSFAYSD